MKVARGSTPPSDRNDESRVPTLSIITPTWERAEYLVAVWNGLQRQTRTDFEWIVSNDGSTDNTTTLVRELAGQSSFPVVLITASVRIGKARMDNEAVRRAKGDFIVWCDSDDVLQANAVEELLSGWESIAAADRSKYAAVVTLGETPEAVLDNIFPDVEYVDLPLNAALAKMKNDFVLCGRADLLKQNPFEEVDYVISETSVWNSFGDLNARFIPKVTKRIHYGSANCVSFSGKMEYCRGKAYAMAISRQYVADKQSWLRRSWRLVTYWRYCIIGEVGLFSGVRRWGGGLSTVLQSAIAFPVAAVLAFRDHLLGRVRQSHRGFEEAKKIVRIVDEYFDGPGEKHQADRS